VAVSTGAHVAEVVEQFIGQGRYLILGAGHYHEAILDGDGDGETSLSEEYTDPFTGKTIPPHVHEVLGGRVLGTEGHEHYDIAPVHAASEKRAPMEVQSLVFDKEKFTAAQAKKWAGDHDFHAGKVDEPEGGETVRLRQKEPIEGAVFRTKRIGPGVKAVLMRRKSEAAPTLPFGKEVSERASGPRRTIVLESDRVFEGANVEGRTIRNMRLLGPVPVGKSYTYRGDALDRAVALYEGMQFFIDHAEDGEDRSVWDLAGVIRHPRRSSDGIRGDLESLPTDAGNLVLAIAESIPTAAGPSHHAEVVFNEGETEILEIERVFSVDLVTNPATTRGIFESRRAREEGDETVKTIAEIRAAFPALVVEIEKEAREGALASAEKDWKAKFDPVEKRALDAEGRIAVLESADRVTQAIGKAGSLHAKVREKVISRTAGRVVTLEEAAKVVAEEKEYAEALLAEAGVEVVEDGGEDEPGTDPKGGTVTMLDEVRERMYRAAGLDIPKAEPSGKAKQRKGVA
jgi:hypothetical protein